jgi:PST family polysaccharide transporter
MGKPRGRHLAPSSRQVQNSLQHQGSLRSAIVWSYALKIGRFGITAVVSLLLARMVGPRAYGVVALALTLIVIVQALQNGLSTALIQRSNLTDAHIDAGFWVVTASGLVLGGVAAALSPVWANLMDLPELTWVCLALVPMLLFQAMMVVPEAILRRSHNLRPVAVRTLIASVVGGAVGIGLAIAGQTIWALVAQQVVTAATGAAVLWAVVSWRPRRRPSRQALSDLRDFSLKATAGIVGWTVGNRAGEFVTGRFFGPVAVGVYRLAGRLTDMAMELSVRALQPVALADLARVQDDRPAMVERLTRLQHTAALAGLPAFGILAAGSDPLLALLGPEWEPAAQPLRILCLAAALYIFRQLLGPALEAMGRPGVLARFAWAYALIACAAFVVTGLLTGQLTDVTQLAAISWTAVAIECLVTIPLAWYVMRRHLHSNLWRLIRPAVPAFVAGLAAAATHLISRRFGGLPVWLHLLAAGALGAAVAGLVLRLTDPTAMHYLRWLWAKVLRRQEPDSLVVTSADGRPSILTD